MVYDYQLYSSNNFVHIHIFRLVYFQNPLNILKRGFSLTYKNDKIVKSVKKINKKDTLCIKLNDGNVTVSVEEVNCEI